MASSRFFKSFLDKVFRAAPLNRRQRRARRQTSHFAQLGIESLENRQLMSASPLSPDALKAIAAVTGATALVGSVSPGKVAVANHAPTLQTDAGLAMPAVV